LEAISQSHHCYCRDVYGHFDSVAEQTKPEELGSGVAAALRSNATPPFGQTIGNLFGQSKPDTKGGVLNEIMQALKPAGLAFAGAGDQYTVIIPAHDLVIVRLGHSRGDEVGGET
jgi:hypothetical protein